MYPTLFAVVYVYNQGRGRLEDRGVVSIRHAQVVKCNRQTDVDIEVRRNMSEILRERIFIEAQPLGYMAIVFPCARQLHPPDCANRSMGS
jgi:hypothetical protein